MKKMKQKGFCIILVFMTLWGIIISPKVEGVEKTNLSNEAMLLVTQNSQESLYWLKAIIAEAQETVDMCPCMAGGKVLEEILSTVRYRLQEVPNLKVRLLLQPIFLDENDYKILHTLKKDFSNQFSIQFADYINLPFPEIGVYELHQKLTVVDAKYFVLGGTNFEDLSCTDGSVTPEEDETPRRYMYTKRPLGTRDQDFVGRSEVLGHKIAVNFAKMYRLWEAYAQTKVTILDPEEFLDSIEIRIPDSMNMAYVEELETSSKLRAVAHNNIEFLSGGPYQQKSINPITEAYLDLIKNAKTSIKITNLFFMPNKELLNAFKEALNRGVSIELITNGINDRSPDLTKMFAWGSRYCFPDLFWGRSISFWDQNKIDSFPIKDVGIYEYYVKEVELHKKVMIVDDQHVILGSYNIGYKSSAVDYEAVILVKDHPQIAADAIAIFNKDRSLSKKITIKETKQWFFNIKLNALAMFQYRWQVG
ncbi:Uncharacterized protein CLAVI_000520 [Candidatus Clavichlamydia salmonicola]|uniref:phospholipase D-like domain-containing protein n=1 Tax=Candidatus Clavichlamydia salmonicola TaxID=469812 RepID=UPI00189114C9|nr:phosphatidylserine/phosphatidylglycerophosphate/cardiolipin synthase family protein [Candidatus Clavichlamydia salmonicola]MBF5050898.1 Uncharacterized protein [Candidatus Clavichlamydia salmonicola]